MMSDAELDYIFSLTDEEEYPGYVSENTAPEIMKQAIMGHIEQIRREKPAIAEKIERYWKEASATDIVRGT